jgi:subtilase family serine protease
MSVNWKSAVNLRNAINLVPAFIALPFLFGTAISQAQINTEPARKLISERIEENRLVTLHGNVRSAANAQNDRGRVEDSLPLNHMLLELRRSPSEERALEQFIDELHDPNSPNFHQWVTAAQLGEQFGPSDQDIAAITGWLGSHGFAVNLVYPDRMMIDFSGTAGAIRGAFHTEIHRLNVKGETHIANMTDPQIPAALAPVVTGVVSLHDFKPQAMHRPRHDYTFTYETYPYQAVVPADLATIYNLNPLFNAGITGAGQTIVVIEDTDLYNGNNDWDTFRTTFGLTGYPGSLTTIHPAPSSGPTNCSDPGVSAAPYYDDFEAAVDVEWSTSAAPGAAIEVASCNDTETTFGGLFALQNLLTLAHPPSIVSISYGECESQNGAAANAAYSSTYQTAVAAGVSVFVSAGDSGAASCDADENYSTLGVAVSGYASTPYNVAVGGTDFSDNYAGTASTYWSSTNTSTYGSALSYVPEIPWNDSCASYLWYSSYGYSAAYGTDGFCNSGYANPITYFLTTAAGSGGPSNCATSTATTCTGGWPKPSWQSGVLGIAPDGVRDIPDVSMFAADGAWGHYCVLCYSDPGTQSSPSGGYPCTGAPSNWAGAGGTSFGAPILAGIQALVNQKTGDRWGNPNTVYYKLAATQSLDTSRVCDASQGNKTSPTCIFHDVMEGDIDLPCSGTINCYGSSTVTGLDPNQPPRTIYGVLSVSNTSLSPAFGATVGWNFATGLGSVNAANLVNEWSDTSTPKKPPR